MLDNMYKNYFIRIDAIAQVLSHVRRKWVLEISALELNFSIFRLASRFCFFYFYYYYFFSVYSDSINLFITTSTLLLGYACRVMSTASDLSAKHTRDRTDAEPCPPGRRFLCPACRARSDIKQHTHTRTRVHTHTCT